MTGEVRHAAYELLFSFPIRTARGYISKRRGFLFGVSVGDRNFVSETSLLPEFGTEHFEHAERVVQLETTNFASAPATSFGLDCIRWMSEVKSHTGLELPVSAFLTGREYGGLEEEARTAVDEGFVSAKFKIGAYPHEEEAELIDYVHYVAPSLRLRLDGNLRTSGFIEKLLEEDLPTSAIEWLEDPLPSSGDWRKLRERSGIPLASDEAFSPSALQDDETWDKFDVLVVKPERYGPIAELEKVCARAGAKGKKVVFSSMYASGVGLALIAALAQEYGSQDVAHGLGTSDVFLQDTLTEPLAMRGGRLIVPPLDELAELLRPEWREKLGFSAA